MSDPFDEIDKAVAKFDASVDKAVAKFDNSLPKYQVSEIEAIEKGLDDFEASLDQKPKYEPKGFWQALLGK
jgi:hypothetical protein